MQANRNLFMLFMLFIKDHPFPVLPEPFLVSVYNTPPKTNKP